MVRKQGYHHPSAFIRIAPAPTEKVNASNLNSSGSKGACAMAGYRAGRTAIQLAPMPQKRVKIRPAITKVSFMGAFLSLIPSSPGLPLNFAKKIF